LLKELWIPLSILAGWSGSLWLVGTIDLATCPLGTFLILLAVRTFLQTGLFITAHDAMHGTIWPGRPQVNWAIGQLCVTLYALLPYQLLYVNHQLHHRYPGTVRDPDFFDRPLWVWYCCFIGSYLQNVWWHWLPCMVAVVACWLCWGWPLSNLLLLWLLPLLLSSFQLFYFGTFLPHRADRSVLLPAEATARSSSLTVTWSLLTCYHFGYHQEHHKYPYLPWHDLPTVKKM
jgi:beta-carotene/zeaxanthin 4-ketolase